MNSPERYVFDTNVIISALLFASSVPGQAFFSALERGRILLSLPVLEELSEVLNRKKFDRYLSQEDRDRFLAALIREAVLIEITETIHAVIPKTTSFWNWQLTAWPTAWLPATTICCRSIPSEVSRF